MRHFVGLLILAFVLSSCSTDDFAFEIGPADVVDRFEQFAQPVQQATGAPGTTSFCAAAQSTPMRWQGSQDAGDLERFAASWRDVEAPTDVSDDVASLVSQAEARLEWVRVRTAGEYADPPIWSSGHADNVERIVDQAVASCDLPMFIDPARSPLASVGFSTSARCTQSLELLERGIAEYVELRGEAPQHVAQVRAANRAEFMRLSDAGQEPIDAWFGPDAHGLVDGIVVAAPPCDGE